MHFHVFHFFKLIFARQLNMHNAASVVAPGRKFKRALIGRKHHIKHAVSDAVNDNLHIGKLRNLIQFIMLRLRKDGKPLFSGLIRIFSG